MRVRAVTELPGFFALLEPREWRALEVAAALLEPGTEVPATTRFGVVDLGRFPDGLAYVGAAVRETDGGPRKYRRVAAGSWPTSAAGPAARATRSSESRPAASQVIAFASADGDRHARGVRGRVVVVDDGRGGRELLRESTATPAAARARAKALCVEYMRGGSRTARAVDDDTGEVLGAWYRAANGAVKRRPAEEL